MNQLPVYILAGGRSSRFGSDKARALLYGEALIARLARLAAPIASTITVVADAADRYADLGLRTIADRRPGLGPLAGLEAAMLDLIDSPPAERRSPEPFPWLAVMTCDMTGLQPAWIEGLHSATRAGVQVVAFCDAEGRRHPFPGLYHANLLVALQQRLDAGSLAVHELIAAAGHIDLPLPAGWPDVAQVNTPDDLRRAARGLC